MKFVNKMIKNSMEAKDLRIGNYVSVDECSTWAITELDIVAVCTFKGSHKPIPLTEEWLKRFGYYTSNGPWGTIAVRGDGRKTTYQLDRYGEYWTHDREGYRVDLKYVHQLQNLYFALTNTELEIK